MKKCTASSSSGPEDTVKDTTFPDPLTELLRKGARDLIAKAVEAELEALLEACSSLCLLQNKRDKGFPSCKIQKILYVIELVAA